MALNDVYQVQVYQNVGSELTMNVFHLRESVAETGAGVGADNAIQVAYDLYTLWAAMLSVDWRVTQIKARRVSPGGGVPRMIVFGGAEAIVGEVEGDIVPSAAAVLVSLYTDTPDRTGRGRQYIPGLPSPSQNEGQLTEAVYAANASALEGFYEGEQTPITAVTGKYRFIVHGGGGSPSQPWDVDTAVLQPNLATQRRRRAHPGFGA